MVMNQINRGPLDPDDGTVYTGTTPPETIVDDLDALSNADLSHPSAPWPGSTFVIRSASCGRFLTLFDGKIVLSHQDDRSSMRWACSEREGWLGFRNPVSGKYIGYSGDGTLHCSAGRHKANACFAVRPMPGEAMSCS